MSQDDIQICHEWTVFHYIRANKWSPMDFMYSNSFVSDLIRGVKFDIFCGMLTENECVVVLSKTPCTPVSASFKILINSIDEYEETHVDAWINNCTLKYNYLSKTIKCPSFYHASYTFQCTITWHGFKESIPNGIYANLKNFLTSPDLSDMAIVIGEKEIPVHKVLLAAYSPVFLTMIKSDSTKSVNKRIIVTDIEDSMMKKVINFMYTGVIYPVPEMCDLLSILQVADKYEIMALKTFCERKLIEKFEVENVLEILDEASEYRVPQLMKTATSFMVENKSAIMKLEKLADLHRRKPEILLDFVVGSIAADHYTEKPNTIVK
ncbi:hypothetical protein PV325_007826 [Microctonus aethiopoides]|nr:hypothetical protein PV325_007826 [Microctonus aethiopoides]